MPVRQGENTKANSELFSSMLTNSFSTAVSMDAYLISNQTMIFLAMYQGPSRRLSYHCHGADVIYIRHDILCDSHLDAALHTDGIRVYDDVLCDSYLDAGLRIDGTRVHDDALCDKYPAHDVQYDDAYAYAAFCVLNHPCSAYGDHIYYYGFANGGLLQSNGHHHRLRLPVR